MIKKVTLLFTLLISTTSCSLLHFFYLTGQANETEKQISYFLRKEEIPYDYSLLLLDSVWYKLNEERHALNMYRLRTETSASLIQLRLYNNKGEIINGYTKSYGKFDRMDFLNTNLGLFKNIMPTNYNLRLEDEFELFDITETMKKEILSKARESDRIILCYWNIWRLDYSMPMLKAIKKYKRTHPNERGLVILVNTGLDPNKVPMTTKYVPTN